MTGHKQLIHVNKIEPNQYSGTKQVKVTRK